MAEFMKYLGIVAFLVFIYLVVEHAQQSANVITSLSKANTNTILALQGRGGNQFVS
jgi:hypothetical protein